MNEPRSAIPDADATLTVDVTETSDPPAAVFEVVDHGDEYGIRCIGRGDDVPGALHDLADRLEDGETQVKTLARGSDE